MMLKWPFVNKYIFGLLNLDALTSVPVILTSSSRQAPATFCAAAKPLNINIRDIPRTKFLIIEIFLLTR